MYAGLKPCNFTHTIFRRSYSMFVSILSLLQVLGAAWYVLSVDRYLSCWKSICKKEDSPTKCFLEYLNCDAGDNEPRNIWISATNVFKTCNPDESNYFNFGIFENAVTKQVVSSSFVQKYFYCLWWGLQNLRCLFPAIFNILRYCFI